MPTDRERINELRVNLALVQEGLGAPEDTRWSCLPEVARELRARVVELENERAQLRAALTDRDGLYERVGELEAQARNMDDGLRSFMRMIDAVSDFIDERPEFIRALRNCADTVDEYQRWSGGAEARRQLAERLGWTVPAEDGDRTVPKEKIPVPDEDASPLGYLAGYPVGDSGQLLVEADAERAFGTRELAQLCVDKLNELDDDGVDGWLVLELHPEQAR